MSSPADPTFIAQLEKSLQSDSTEQLNTLIETHGKAFLTRVIAFNVNERKTPLTFATVTPSSPPKIVEFLVSLDNNLVNLSKDPPFECGALHFASMNDSRYQKANIMLKHGAFVNAIDNQGNTPFHHACTYGAHKIVRLLLQYGADPSIRNNNDETAYGIAQDHKDPYVLAAIMKEIQKYNETIEEDEEERASRGDVIKNQMDIDDIRKELMDMRRSIASLKKNDDEKDDKITSLQRNELASEIKQLKQNQTKLADDVNIISELEQEVSHFKTIVNEMTAKLKSKETELNCLKEKQESFERTARTSRGIIYRSNASVAEIQEHQMKHRTAILENTTNIRMNGLKIDSVNQSTLSLGQDLCQCSSKMAIKLESLKKESKQEIQRRVNIAQPIKSKFEDLGVQVETEQITSDMIKSVNSKVVKLQKSAQSQNNAIKNNTEVIKSIISKSSRNSESREVVQCSNRLPPIPLVVEEFKDESLTDVSPKDKCNNPPKSSATQNGNVPETKPCDVRTKCRMDSSKDKTKCSEDTPDPNHDKTEFNMDKVVPSEDKSKLTHGTVSTSETILKTVWECDKTIPKRFAYDDSQLNLRNGFVAGAAEFRSSRRRRWSGDTNRIRECVTMTGKRYVEDHTQFDITDSFLDGTIKRRKCLEIKTVKRAIRSLSSLDSCCPPPSTPDSSVAEEESEDC